MGEEEGLIKKLDKVLYLERMEGYKDSAVLGGLEGFIEQSFHKIMNFQNEQVRALASELVDRIRGYSRMSLGERREALRELENFLRAMETEGEASPSEDLPEEGMLKTPIRHAKGVGKRREKLLKRLGMETIEDLLFYFPRRIEDRSQIKRIAALRHGERATIQGRVRAVDLIRPRGDMAVLKAAIQDNSGIAFGVWFNQPWLKNQFAKGEKIALYGEVDRSYGQTQINSPVWEPAGENFQTGRLVPIYPSTEGLPQVTLLRIIQDNLSAYRGSIRDVLPEQVRARHGLLPRAEAFQRIHFPKTLEEYEQARITLAFEEFFLFQIGVGIERQRTAQQIGRKLLINDELLESFIGSLPFELTKAQRKAIDEIRDDVGAAAPMNRLLQGDVGSGKTVVATAACFIAINSDYQAALMAPTEILAEQHYRVISELLEFGTASPPSVELLIGSLPEKEKAEIRERVRRGEVDLLIGTHALIQDEVQFNRLGFAVIDEQHRFGVIQRAQLEKKGDNIDILVMSATPIPRTITLTLYGQFDISLLSELPWEKRVSTYWVSEDKRAEIYKLVLEKLEEGGQAYVVYPLVEESEELDLKAATQMKEELERGPFKAKKVGLIHGRMNEVEKQQVMERVRDREIDVLVATTIIEVGIDVPDASIMVIEHADRFGLSQLHQLRGRIGRVGQRAYCFAIATPKTEEAYKRLSAFREIDDGFAIAEEDLKIRGPGELLGLAQHGLDTTFKAADLLRDIELMKRAREEAFTLVKESPDDPLVEKFKERFGERFEWARF